MKKFFAAAALVLTMTLPTIASAETNTNVELTKHEAALPESVLITVLPVEPLKVSKLHFER